MNYLALQTTPTHTSPCYVNVIILGLFSKLKYIRLIFWGQRLLRVYCFLDLLMKSTCFLENVEFLYRSCYGFLWLCLGICCNRENCNSEMEFMVNIFRSLDGSNCFVWQWAAYSHAIIMCVQLYEIHVFQIKLLHFYVYNLNWILD